MHTIVYIRLTGLHLHTVHREGKVQSRQKILKRSLRDDRKSLLCIVLIKPALHTSDTEDEVPKWKKIQPEDALWP